MYLTQADETFLRSVNLDKDAILSQVELIKKGPKYLTLIKPLTKGDGVKTLSKEEQAYYSEKYQAFLPTINPIKFVPASGAASRMFEDLTKAYRSGEDLNALFASRHNIRLEDYFANTFLFFENIDKLAIFREIKEAFKSEKVSVEKLISDGDVTTLLKKMLEKDGLNYENIPKALVKFHYYHEGDVRTPIEEHLVEAGYYCTGKDQICKIHFTVSHSNRGSFIEFLARVKDKYENKLKCRYEIDITEQDPSTNTIAIDDDGQIVRTEYGQILLRPGGHGTLLANLQKIEAPLIFIKNIDNVCHDHFKPDVIFWKKVLAGLLLEMKERIEGYIRGVREGTISPKEVYFFLRDEMMVLADNSKGYHESREGVLRALLRPIRVCGVVRDVKEPGGAPFWVRDESGQVTPQIVEKAQVDLGNPEQRGIFESSEYFNPVDIVCSTQDETGKPYDLMSFSDEGAYMVTEKQYRGKKIRVLEYPGLWNGRMAHWLSIFVEVPAQTFFPVKKVTDLLRSGHVPKFK